MQTYSPQFPQQFQSQFPSQMQLQQITFNTQQAQQSQFSVSNENNNKPPNYDAFIDQTPTIRIDGNDVESTIPVIPASTVSNNTK